MRLGIMPHFEVGLMKFKLVSMLSRAGVLFGGVGIVVPVATKLIT